MKCHMQYDAENLTTFEIQINTIQVGQTQPATRKKSSTVNTMRNW